MRTLWFFHFILDNDNLFLSKIVFYRPMFLRKSSKYSSTRLAQSFSVILTFFTHIVLSSVFYRGCWRTSMSCFTAAHSRGKQWWLQIWSSCCKFLTIVGPWMHVFYLNPFMPQYPHTLLQTDLHTFPLRISWENLFEDQSISMRWWLS